MSQYCLLTAPSAVLTADSPLVRAADIERVGALSDLIAALTAERASVPAEREAARAEGFAAGRTEGEAAGREETVQAASAEVAGALAALGAQRTDARAEAAELALAIVRRVLPQVAGDAMLARLIETAAAELQDEQPHAVRVPPSDVGSVAEALEGTGLTVEADETLGDDQAVLLTRTGTAEAGLEARLGVLMEPLRR